MTKKVQKTSSEKIETLGIFKPSKEAVEKAIEQSEKDFRENNFTELTYYYRNISEHFVSFRLQQMYLTSNKTQNEVKTIH